MQNEKCKIDVLKVVSDRSAEDFDRTQPNDLDIRI